LNELLGQSVSETLKLYRGVMDVSVVSTGFLRGRRRRKTRTLQMRVLSSNIAKNVIGPFVKIALILRLKVCTIAAFLDVISNK
jgi:hypothetical protein